METKWKTIRWILGGSLIVVVPVLIFFPPAAFLASLIGGACGFVALKLSRLTRQSIRDVFNEQPSPYPLTDREATTQQQVGSAALENRDDLEIQEKCGLTEQSMVDSVKELSPGYMLAALGSLAAGAAAALLIVFIFSGAQPQISWPKLNIVATPWVILCGLYLGLALGKSFRPELRLALAILGITILVTAIVIQMNMIFLQMHSSIDWYRLHSSWDIDRLKFHMPLAIMAAFPIAISSLVTMRHSWCILRSSGKHINMLIMLITLGGITAATIVGLHLNRGLGEFVVSDVTTPVEKTIKAPFIPFRNVALFVALDGQLDGDATVSIVSKGSSQGIILSGSINDKDIGGTQTWEDDLVVRFQPGSARQGRLRIHMSEKPISEK